MSVERRSEIESVGGLGVREVKAETKTHGGHETSQI
jgi:hypothetical protein